MGMVKRAQGFGLLAGKGSISLLGGGMEKPLGPFILNHIHPNNHYSHPSSILAEEH